MIGVIDDLNIKSQKMKAANEAYRQTHINNISDDKLMRMTPEEVKNSLLASTKNLK